MKDSLKRYPYTCALLVSVKQMTSVERTDCQY